jgi:hypothetical protein
MKMLARHFCCDESADVQPVQKLSDNWSIESFSQICRQRCSLYLIKVSKQLIVAIATNASRCDRRIGGILAYSVRAIDFLCCCQRQADARLTTVNELDPCGFKSTPDRRGRHAVRT